MNPALWSLLAGGVGLVGSGVLARGVFSPSSGIFGATMNRLVGPGDRVGLSFDDGPWPGSTDLILDELARTESLATFFVIGRYVERHPELVRRMHDEGHLIGNHTYDHHRGGLFRGAGYWREQLTRTDDAIEKIIGERPVYFRPPMGFKAPPQALALRRSSHRIVAWSCRACDGVAPREERIIESGGRLVSGDILLLHDGRDPASKRDCGVTAGALPGLLAGLKGRGLRAVRIDDGL